MTTTGQITSGPVDPFSTNERVHRVAHRATRVSAAAKPFASQTQALAAVQALAERLREAKDRLWDPDFPENGSFSRVQKRSPAGEGRAHWYFDCYQPAGRKQGTGKGIRRYIGAVGDPHVEARIQAFNKVKTCRGQFAAEVAALTASGLPSPPRFIGKLINAIARAGIFNQGGVLLGTPAYQTYDAILGVVLVQAPGTHGELGARNIRTVTVAVHSLDVPAVAGELIHIDPTFEASETEQGWQFLNRAGYRVKVTRIAGSTAANQIACFLADDALNALVLSGSGVSVRVPAPVRFALAKQIQWACPTDNIFRRTAKISQMQADQIFDAIIYRGQEAILRARGAARALSMSVSSNAS